MKRLDFIVIVTYFIKYTFCTLACCYRAVDIIIIIIIIIVITI